MERDIPPQLWIGIALILLGVWLAKGAILAYQSSVGTPYYAGIVELSIIPGVPIVAGIVFPIWAAMDDNGKSS